MKKIMKWCGLSENQDKGMFIRSHINFLRTGDRFQIPKVGLFKATSDPYFNPAIKTMDIKMIRIEEQ